MGGMTAVLMQKCCCFPPGNSTLGGSQGEPHWGTPAPPLHPCKHCTETHYSLCPPRLHCWVSGRRFLPPSESVPPPHLCSQSLAISSTSLGALQTPSCAHTQTHSGVYLPLLWESVPGCFLCHTHPHLRNPLALGYDGESPFTTYCAECVSVCGVPPQPPATISLHS